ncbi:MAG: T9SS type A sorting domain-containing protein [Aequorivita sp.]|nr:T9SS type A sorting domain-containing protein [Aequorivita sp.]
MNSKILFSGLLVFIISASNFLFGQCPNGFVTFTSQSQIDNFIINYPNCTEINGTLKIEENVSGGITNLNGLAQITEVETLRIQYNSALTNLNGLNNLTTITNDQSSGRLLIRNNQSLENLDGLENLQEVQRYFTILENPMLSSIEGLGNLSSTTLGIEINSNPSLISLTGLNGITITRGLSISYNDLLIDLDGLNNITETGALSIHNNQNLINLEGLNNLVSITGEIGARIEDNSSLESVDGLDSLVSSNGFFTIRNNTALTNVEGLANFTTCLNMFGISDCPSLTNLSGLENLTNAPTLAFVDNDQLNDISALSNFDINLLYQILLYGNPELAVCDYPNICQYLNNPSNYASIYNNATGCNTREEILQACGLLNNNENLGENNFSIYPNPTSNTFIISGIDRGTIQITDSHGRILKTFSLGKDETSLNGFAEGIYFVNISNDKGSVTKQLIKI